MKRLLIASTMLLAAVPVFAADLRMPVKTPPPVVATIFSWSGCYIGVRLAGSARAIGRT